MTLHTSVQDQPIQWIVPDFVVTWRDESCEWKFLPYRRDFASGSATILAKGITYGFLMAAPASKLGQLTLDFAGPMDKATGLSVELWTGNGALLRRGFVPSAAIQGYGQAPILDLTGLQFEIGAKLHVRLGVVALDEEGQVMIAASEQPTTGMAFRRQVTRLRNERTFVYDRAASVAAANLVVLPRGAGLAEAKPALELLAQAFPGEPFTGIYADGVAELWAAMEASRVVAFANFHRAAQDLGRDYDRLCFELYRAGVCTLAIDTEALPHSPVTDGPVARTVRSAVEDQQRCRFILRGGAAPMIAGAHSPLEPMADAPELGHRHSLTALCELARKSMLPRVAIVSVLHRKGDLIQAFLEQIRDQSYPGEIAVVLVDHGSPEPDAALAEMFGKRLQAFGQANRSVRLVRNKDNANHGQSRMTGIMEEHADLYVVLDPDCLINRDFVAAHVFEHASPEVEVVIGPLIEAGVRNPIALLQALEQDPGQIDRERGARDPVQADGFLNCRAGNISIARRALPAEGLYDPDFSREPDAEFGWGEVEMAYRLYARGARVRFTPKAFSVRAACAYSDSETTRVRGMMVGLEQLFAKHEALPLVARRWAEGVSDEIMRSADRNGLESDDVRRRLQARFGSTREQQAPLLSLIRGEKRRLRILSYRWHVPHQYELYKLPHDFTLVTGVGDNGMVERWSHDQRPLRANAQLKPASEIDPADYDVALLHFDENVLAPEWCNNTIPAAWGDPFHWLLATDLPKVAICHGTPQFVGQYGADAQRKLAFTLHEDERQRLVALMAAARVRVVCNSHQAHEEWGFASGQVIWHGFDPQEFPLGRGDLDVLALNADRHRPHYRGAWEQREVEALLDPGIRIDSPRHFGGALELRGSNAYATARFRAYVEQIGRFKAYLNTTLRSPMPRSRGEAMMTGVVPICLDNHDVSRFIENGVNGFYSNEPGELADFLNHLCRDEDRARRMRAAARRTALDVFNHDRYLSAWASLLERVAE